MSTTDYRTTKTCVRFLGTLAALIGFAVLSFGDDNLLSLVDGAADALKNYAKDHSGQLPNTLHALYPTYSTTNRWYVDDIPLPIILNTNVTQILPRTPIVLIYVPNDRLPLPNQGDKKLIAFTSRQSEAGYRYAIADDFLVWMIGEGAFQDNLAGKSIGDDPTATINNE